jgi:hypothetical protein
MKSQFGFVLLCKDCGNFDRPSNRFESTNLCRCRADGQKHWAGDEAVNCLNFVEIPNSKIAALASGY